MIQASLSHGHLVVATTSQANIYTTKNWNTPTIIDLKVTTLKFKLKDSAFFSFFFLVIPGLFRIISSESLKFCTQFVRTTNQEARLINECVKSPVAPLPSATNLSPSYRCKRSPKFIKKCVQSTTIGCNFLTTNCSPVLTRERLTNADSLRK